MTSLIAPVKSRPEEYRALSSRLHELNLQEFWDESYGAGEEHYALKRIMAKEKAVPYLWKYADVWPLLLESGRLIDIHLSERRSILMANPGITASVATVATMLAAYRINLPDEIAPAHRHTPNAIRFGLTGRTNFTAVDGEHIVFGPGDLVLTPHDTWHNHGNGGDADAVNFSLLDWPLVNYLNAVEFDFDYTEEEGGEILQREVQSERYANDYSNRVYGRGGLTPRFVSHHRGAGKSSPMFVYRWEATHAALRDLHDHEGSPYDGIFLEYTDPVNGGPVYHTLSFGVQMLRGGEKLLPQRQNANRIYTVFEGQGYSEIDGTRFDWTTFDTFCVPGGSWCRHVNESASDAILMLSSDEPALRNLSLLKKHGRNEAGDVVLLQ